MTPKEYPANLLTWETWTIMVELITLLSGLVASTLLGAIKKQTTLLDRKIGEFIKPFQPIVVLGVSIALPMLGDALGIANLPTAEVLAAAPATTLAMVAARESLKRLKKNGAAKQSQSRYR